MASENTVFYEKLAEAFCNYPCLYDKSWLAVTNFKKPFVLVLVSEHSQVSQINAAVIRKSWVKKCPASAEQQKQQENFVFRHFENVPRPILPRLPSGAYCACVCHFLCAYATGVNIRYAYVAV